jgi:protein-disulfide isomerase
MIGRRLLLAATLASIASGALAAPKQDADDMAMGNPKARVEVIEYASASCPHCAHFNEVVFPGLKSKWIDTGKVHYVMKEMLTPPEIVAVAGFRIARCAGPDKYFKVVDDVFRSQPRWTNGQIKPILQQVAADNGLDEAHFNACLADEAAAQAIADRAQRAAEQDGVTGTPTLFVNGAKLDPTPMTPEDMDAAITAALKAPAPKAAPANKAAAAKAKGGRK